MAISEEEILAVLQHGQMEAIDRLPYSSNYNLLVLIRSDEHELPAVYKPRRGENPLWDFISGTLCQREVAAYQVCAMLGWSLIPPTVLRDGVHGVGSVQFYIEHNDAEHYFTIQEDALYAENFRQLALFDFITNNADRKSGHCLIDDSRRLWAIDHGICFHEEYKLRTVIWEFAGQPIEEHLIDDIENFHSALQAYELDASSAECAAVSSSKTSSKTSSKEPTKIPQLLSPAELTSLSQRTTFLLENRRYPEPLPDRRNYPWPPV